MTHYKVKIFYENSSKLKNIVGDIDKVDMLKLINWAINLHRQNDGE